MVRALISVSELNGLEGLAQQHLRTLRRLEGLTEQAAEYDVTPTELVQVEAEARRLQKQIKATLETWQERL